MTPDSERRNSTAMYNPMMISELKAMYPSFDWSLYFDGVFTHNNVTVGDDERIIVVQPDFFEATETLNTDPRVVGRKVGRRRRIYLVFLTSHNYFSKLFRLQRMDVFCW